MNVEQRIHDELVTLGLQPKLVEGETPSGHQCVVIFAYGVPTGRFRGQKLMVGLSTQCEAIGYPEVPPHWIFLSPARLGHTRWPQPRRVLARWRGMGGFEQAARRVLGSSAPQGNEGLHGAPEQGAAPDMTSAAWREVLLPAEVDRDACSHLLQHYQRGEVQEDLCFGAMDAEYRLAPPDSDSHGHHRSKPSREGPARERELRRRVLGEGYASGHCQGKGAGVHAQSPELRLAGHERT